MQKTENIKEKKISKNNNLESLSLNGKLKFDWEAEEILKILNLPLTKLIHKAQSLHIKFHPENTVQLASLLSIKTGGCPEDCKYCPQSAHYSKKTGVKREQLLSVKTVIEKAKKAKEAGANRFCMGAAWRQIKDGADFDNVLEMIKQVRRLGLEACVTLGMLNARQAVKLAEAGLTAYNHNLDTSPEFYKKIITTRTYEDRIQTIKNVRKAGIHVCSGGIIGMGESDFDRARMLQELANLKPHPESVPINALVSIPGTPLENIKTVQSTEIIRMIATARIIMPASRVRLSAGRKNFSQDAQILCFLAGANSIFFGEKLLTTENNDTVEDLRMIKEAGFKIEESNSTSNG